jgi:hypothetical protein
MKLHVRVVGMMKNMYTKFQLKIQLQQKRYKINKSQSKMTIQLFCLSLLIC